MVRVSLIRFAKIHQKCRIKNLMLFTKLKKNKNKKKKHKTGHNTHYPNTYNTGTNKGTVFMEKEKCKHSTINR